MQNKKVIEFDNEPNIFNKNKCSYCRIDNHHISNCFLFAKILIGKKIDIVCQKHICFQCLSTCHRRKICTDRRKCEVCNYNFQLSREYRPLLYSSNNSNKKEANKDTTTTNSARNYPSSSNTEIGTENCSLITDNENLTSFSKMWLLRVIPVWIRKKE